MFGESGASAKNCIWSATLTQRARAKVTVVKLERWCQDKMWGTPFPRRPAQHGLSSFARNSRFCSHAHITHRTSQKAELFCEIRMLCQAAVAID
jgi:hypothetical protein